MQVSCIFAIARVVPNVASVEPIRSPANYGFGLEGSRPSDRNDMRSRDRGRSETPVRTFMVAKGTPGRKFSNLASKNHVSTSFRGWQYARSGLGMQWAPRSLLAAPRLFRCIKPLPGASHGAALRQDLNRYGVEEARTPQDVDRLLGRDSSAVLGTLGCLSWPETAWLSVESCRIRRTPILLRNAPRL